MMPAFIPDDRPVALMLRHAERYQITHMNNAMEPLLTEKGKDDAMRYGRELSKMAIACPLHLYHSPVERCKETAEAIQSGLESVNITSLLKGMDINLGGPYITGDWREVAASAEEVGFLNFVRMWFNGEVKSGLVLPLKEAAEQQLDVLRAHLEKNDYSTLHVTHDWNLMIMREYFFEITHEDWGVPDFLDTIAAYMDNDRLHLHYYDRTVTL